MDYLEKNKIRKMILIGIFAVPLILVIGAILVEKLSIKAISARLPESQNPNPDSSITRTLPGPVLSSGEENSNPEVQPEKEDEKNNDQRVNVRHILVSFKGAFEAEETVKLSKEEAYDIALEVRERLLLNPDTFDSVAKEFSHDKATGMYGGLIPGFSLSNVDGSFRAAITALKSGGISSVIETPFGFHIIKREDVEEGIFQSILISFKGALHAAPGLDRSEEQAKKKAEGILEQLKKGEKTFYELAVEYSEDPWQKNGGFMNGIVQTGSIPHKAIEETAFSLKEGDFSGLIKSPLGYQILKRHPVEARQACQIVVLYGKNGRVEEEARRKIYDALRELREGRSFSEIVKKYSDESFEKTGGGFTSVIYRGTWEPEIERRLFSMKPAEVSMPFKLDYGWVIIARVR